MATVSARARSGAPTDPLRPFVPRIAADWLRDAPATVTQTFEGTLVFADVSGFTELTEKLAKRGREGAEEIATVLDAAFAELIAAAYAHHADLLKFGGDAVLLLFRGENHAHRAATAALGMQDALAGMRRLSTSAGPVRLQMSVGMHAGTFHFFLVGGVHRELVVAGADATACVETEAIANAGEVMLSRTTAERFDAELLGPEREGVILLAKSPQAAQIVPPFFDPSGVDLSQLLPAAYTRELRGEPADPEHRHVACAFVEIRGTDDLLEREGPDALAAALDERITAIQESCLSFDVTFAQTDVSKAAVKAILLAGAPRSSGGDEEELILRACRAIVERRATLPVRVGVNAGRVFAGIVGPPTRRTYTFYGDAINTAARIMVRGADAQLLVREDVLERARTTYAVTPIEPFAAKGKAELVRASDVGPAVGEREPEAIGPFVGRERELDALLAALTRAREGEGSVALVTGEAGLGKTRLLGELRAQVSGVRSVRVQCSQVGASHPYLAAGQIIRRALQLGPHAPVAEVERRLRGAVGAAAPHLEPWLPLLGLVVGVELPPTPETAALDERFVPERIAASVESLLEGLVPDAALVVIDDVHFMDEASTELIARVARGIRDRRWLIVVARRAYEGGFEVPEGVAPVEVELGPLPTEAAVTLVEQLTEDAPLPGHVTDTIAARSAGSPLFLTEMVAALRRGADLDALPRSVEAMMAVQIDDLASADRAVLRQASVLGARFDRASFVQALDLEEAQAEAALARLDRFLVADGEGGIRFRHGLLRDAAYHGLSFRRRRELHRRVGEALERGAGTDVSAVADQLTRHFFEAGDWEKVLRYGLVAGREARAVFANQDAAALLERALAAGAKLRGTRPELVTRIAESLGDVRLVLGETDAAIEAFRLARRRVHGDPVEEARLIEREATVLARSGENKKVRRLLSQGNRRLEGVHSLRAAATRAAIDAQRAVVEQRLGRPRAAIELAHRAIEEAETADAREPLAQALALLDFSYTTIGQRDRAVHSRRALELYEGLGLVGRRASLLLNLGVLAYYAGNWGEAVELYGQARDAFEAAGDRWYAAAGTFNIGEVLVAQGRLDEAEPVLRQALREGLVVGGGSRSAEVDSELGRLLGRRGDLDGAVFHLERARQAFIADGEQLGVLDVDARLAEAHLLAGNVDESLTRARSVLDAVGEDEEASLLVPGLRRVEGVALARSGDLAGAVAALEASLGASDELGSSYDAALALDALLDAGAPDAERRVRRDRLFEQLGIVAAPGRGA